jgi:hypothetical protein
VCCDTLIFPQTPDVPFAPRQVFMHSGESEEPVVNESNTLEARLRRIARENH